MAVSDTSETRTAQAVARRPHSVMRNNLLVLAAGVICITTACSSGKRHLTIGAQSTTAQSVVAEILAQHIAAKTGIEVSVRPALGMTETTYQALLIRETDICFDTIGAIFSNILKESPEKDAGVVLERLRTELDRTARIQVLESLDFEMPFTLVVRASDAQERKVKTMSDAVGYKPGWDLAMTSDFQSRPDGNTMLRTAYSLPLKSVPVTRAPEEMYKLLQDGYMTMVVGTVVDGQLGDPAFVALEDDKHALPPSQVWVFVRDDTNQAFPDLKGCIAQLKGKLSADILRKLNFQVDVKHRVARDVAADFLAGKAQ